MTELERTARVHMMRYEFYIDEHAKLLSDISLQSPQFDKIGGPSGRISNPTERMGIELAEKMEAIEYGMKWVSVIDDAIEYCRSLDQGHEFGFAYILEQITSRRRGRSKTQVRKRCCIDCGISSRTYYAWLARITTIVSAMAASRKLI